jgi:hypothetical protein
MSESGIRKAGRPPGDAVGNVSTRCPADARDMKLLAYLPQSARLRCAEINQRINQRRTVVVERLDTVPNSVDLIAVGKSIE